MRLTGNLDILKPQGEFLVQYNTKQIESAWSVVFETSGVLLPFFCNLKEGFMLLTLKICIKWSMLCPLSEEQIVDHFTKSHFFHMNNNPMCIVYRSNIHIFKRNAHILSCHHVCTLENCCVRHPVSLSTESSSNKWSPH